MMKTKITLWENEDGSLEADLVFNGKHYGSSVSNYSQGEKEKMFLVLFQNTLESLNMLQREN